MPVKEKQTTQNPSVSVMNLPNFFTLIRIFLTPILVICLINEKYMHALMVFAMAGITDGLDGFLARVLHQKTRLGAILDPIADKTLLSSAYVTLAITRQVPSWFAVVVISRDLIIVAGVLILFLTVGSIDIKPTIVGKMTTFFQLITALAILSKAVFKEPNMALDGLYVFTTILTVFSGLQYVMQGFKIWSQVEQQVNNG